MHFFIFLLFSFSLFAEAEKLFTWNPRIQKKGTENSPPPCKPKETKKAPLLSNFEVGGNYTFAHITPTSLNSFHGHLGGARGIYQYRANDAIYGALSLNWKQGNTQGLGGNRFLIIFDAHERIGYTWGFPKKKRFFSLYTGVGYRNYYHDLQTMGSSARFYYNYIYIPVGFAFQGRVNSMTDLGLNFQWMPQVYPTLTINPLKGARWILNKKLVNFIGELPISIYLNKSQSVSLQIKPVFEYWRDGSTNARTASGTFLRIPGNNYLFPGIEINFGFSF